MSAFAHDRRGAAAFQDRLQFRAGKAKVDRHEDRAKSEGREHGEEKCGAVEPEIGHPIPAGYAAVGEHRGEASGSIVELRVREIRRPRIGLRQLPG